MHTLTGHSLIAGQITTGTGTQTTARNPATNETLQPAYTLIDTTQLDAACTAAAAAFEEFSHLAPMTRATYLERIATEIDALGDDLIMRAVLETGLPESRIRGERARTTQQLRLFAQVVRSGDYRGLRIDPAQPQRTPLPRADIRQQLTPLGPVAVFGASNFPLAFSTAGGDTASALAAGCPVVFKAHNAHPGTSELVGQAIATATAATGINPGVFSLIYGPGATIGQALAQHPDIKAVGFTGSQSAGIALMRAAAARPEPIPVYAEMSSLNPVVIYPGAIATPEDLTSVASGYIGAVTGSSGQLCTSPGILFVPNTSAGDALVTALSNLIANCDGQTMLTEGIAGAWHAGVHNLMATNGVTPLGHGTIGPGENAPAPTLFTTDLTTFTHTPALHHEVFGAASLIVRYDHPVDLIGATNSLEGQLTATLHLHESDYPNARDLIPTLERKVGRIIINGWPTGVEVGHAVVHGGPFPATSDSRTTSVGSRAIDRFMRPVAYQGFPQELLPAALTDANPWGFTRLVDGSHTGANS